MNQATTTSIQFDWKKVLQGLADAIVPLLVQVFGEKFGDFFRNLFKNADAEVAPPIILVGAAPDEVKRTLKAWLVKIVETKLIGKPVLRNLALTVINNLPLSFLDSIWDSLFPAEITAKQLPSSATFVSGPVATYCPSPLDPEELKTAAVEAGI